MTLKYYAPQAVWSRNSYGPQASLTLAVAIKLHTVKMNIKVTDRKQTDVAD